MENEDDSRVGSAKRTTTRATRLIFLLHTRRHEHPMTTHVNPRSREPHTTHHLFLPATAGTGAVDPAAVDSM